jgi:hypothetical protein
VDRNGGVLIYGSFNNESETKEYYDRKVGCQAMIQGAKAMWQNDVIW